MNGIEVKRSYRDQLAQEIASQPIEQHGNQPLSISPALAVSLLQKAVRRGDEGMARRATATLVAIAPDRFWRRCIVIVAEEIGVANPEAVALVTTAATAGKSWRSKVDGEITVGQFVTSIMARSDKCRAWTASAVDENSGIVPGGRITTHHNVGVVVLIKVGIERRLADRAPTILLFEQVDAIEASSFPHQTPLPAIFPVVAQVRIEGTDFALDLHEAGHSGFVVARKPEPAVTKDPAVPPIDTVVAVDHPVSCLVGMTALGPFVGDPPHVIVQDAEGALGGRMTVVVAPSPDHWRQCQDHLGRRPLSVHAARRDLMRLASSGLRFCRAIFRS